VEYFENTSWGGDPAELGGDVRLIPSDPTDVRGLYRFHEVSVPTGSLGSD
jgi:hypothetical protein